MRTIRYGSIALVAAVASCCASSARADEPRQRLELRGGARLEGKVLIVTERHVVMDLAGGPRFVERSLVARAFEADGSALELASRETDATRDVVGLVVTQFNQDKIRVARGGGESFEPSALSGEKGLASSLIRVGDQLRTGPWGKATLVIPGDAKLTARSDAVVDFTDRGPSLVRGSVRLEDGNVSLAIPEGRVTGRGVILQADHLRGRTQLTCYHETCKVSGEGWELSLPKKHSIDVANGENERAPYVAANGANPFPVDLRVGGKWIQIQPGEKLCLVVLGGGTRAEDAARSEPSRRWAPEPQDLEPAPARPGPREPEPSASPPAPQDDERVARLRRELAEAEAADRRRRDVAARPPAMPEAGGVGKVSRATAGFWHVRAQQQWKIAPESAGQVTLKPGDELVTEDGRVVATFADQSSFEINRESAFVVSGDEPGGRAPYRLRRGEVTARGQGKLTLAVPTGEATIDGEAIVHVEGSITIVQASSGRASLSVGRDVRADAPEGARITASPADGRLELKADGSRETLVRVGTIELSVAPRRTITAGRTDDGVPLVHLWTNAEVAVDPTLRVRIEDKDGGLCAAVSDGQSVVLEPGRSVRIRPRSEQPLLERPLAPPPADPIAREPARRDPPAAAPRPATPRIDRPGPTERTLSNGAVVSLVNWGPLTERAKRGDEVEIEGPGGAPVVLGPRTRLTLKRSRGVATLATDDRRVVTWNEGGQAAAFTYRLASDGKLTLDVANDRTLSVDAGAQFEVDLRGDGMVHAMIVGNSYFVPPGQHAFVTRSGLREEPKDMAKVGGSR